MISVCRYAFELAYPTPVGVVFEPTCMQYVGGSNSNTTSLAVYRIQYEVWEKAWHTPKKEAI